MAYQRSKSDEHFYIFGSAKNVIEVHIPHVSKRQQAFYLVFDSQRQADRDNAYSLIAALSDLLGFNCRAIIMDRRAHDYALKKRQRKKGYQR